MANTIYTPRYAITYSYTLILTYTCGMTVTFPLKYSLNNTIDDYGNAYIFLHPFYLKRILNIYIGGVIIHHTLYKSSSSYSSSSSVARIFSFFSFKSRKSKSLEVIVVQLSFVVMCCVLYIKSRGTRCSFTRANININV